MSQFFRGEILPPTCQTEEVLCCLAFHFGHGRGGQDVLRRRQRWSSQVLSVRSFGGFFELKMGLGCRSGRKQWAIFCQRVELGWVRSGQKTPAEDSSRGSRFILLTAAFQQSIWQKFVYHKLANEVSLEICL